MGSPLYAGCLFPLGQQRSYCKAMSMMTRPHVVTTNLAGELASAMEHAHAREGSAPVLPDNAVTAASPRVPTLLEALGLAVAGAAAWTFSRHKFRATVCGPPLRLGVLASGRRLLSLLCAFRR